MIDSKEIEFNFQDLQNEECTVRIDHLGNLWIGRRSSVKMNLDKKKLREILEFIENAEDLKK